MEEKRVCFPLKETLETYASFDLGRFVYPNDDIWALPRDTMQFLGRLVELLRPQRMIEFGSGQSTAVLATLLQKHGGRLLSFEHNERFARQTAAAALERGAGGVARVELRPIAIRRYGTKLLPTYSIDWKQFGDFADCELALVDGPPGRIGREAVLYEVFSRLAVGGLVVVDDTSRALDHSWVESWKRVFGGALEIEFFPTIGRGIGVLRKQRGETPRYRFRPAQVWESWRHAAKIWKDLHFFKRQV